MRAHFYLNTERSVLYDVDIWCYGTNEQRPGSDRDRVRQKVGRRVAHPEYSQVRVRRRCCGKVIRRHLAVHSARDILRRVSGTASTDLASCIWKTIRSSGWEPCSGDGSRRPGRRGGRHRRFDAPPRSCRNCTCWPGAANAASDSFNATLPPRTTAAFIGLAIIRFMLRRLTTISPEPTLPGTALRPRGRRRWR